MTPADDHRSSVSESPSALDTQIIIVLPLARSSRLSSESRCRMQPSSTESQAAAPCRPNALPSPRALMKATQFFISTLKEAPADAEVVSHQLMLRAGLIRRLAAGIYTWTPLGMRSLRKVENIVREEMDRAGALELLMPAQQPRELAEETGRWENLYATLAQAQLGDASATGPWRTRLTESWPDYSWELAASAAGDFAPSATAERDLWRDSHAKAELPFCATAEQVARLSIRVLPECDAERAKLAASAP